MDTVSVATAPAQWTSGQRWLVASRGLGTGRPAAVRMFTSVHAEAPSGAAADPAEESPPGLVTPAHPPSNTAVTSQAGTDVSRFLHLLVLAMVFSFPGGTGHTG